MKLYNVCECGDPYEPDGTLAVCTSISKAKKLFPEKLFISCPGTERVDRPRKESAYRCKGSDWLNLITGELVFVSDYPGRPDGPYVHEIETDVKL